MTMRQRLWRLGIVWALLLVQQHSCSSNASTEDPASAAQHYRTAASTGNDEKYHVVDVERQNEDADKLQTGETTRIFTTGEVGDDFWLKHLGEDFKNAIHMQVGGANGGQYDSVYNMTEDGSLYKVHHEYAPKALGPVDRNNENEMRPIEVNYSSEREVKNSAMSSSTTTEAAEREEQSTKLDVDSDETKTNSSSSSTEKTEPKYESVFTIHKQKSYEKSSERRKNQKYTKHTNLRYIQKHKNTNTKNKFKSDYPPVVVNLTEENNRMNMPVVVKMPPVIYHHEALRSYHEDAPTQTQTQTRPTQSHTRTSHSHTSQNTQYMEYPQHTNTPYPHYAGNYYRPDPMYAAPTYNSPNMYASAPSAVSEGSHSATQGLRYIRSKSASANDYIDNNHLPDEPSATLSPSAADSINDNNRENSSSQKELFNQGL